MHSTVRGIAFLLVIFLVVVTCSSHSNATLLFSDTSIGLGQLGGFYGPYLPTDFTLPATPPPVAPPDNDPTFQNYFIGRTSLAKFTTSERRVFFIYDLTALALPAGEKVVDVSIDLEFVGGGATLANFTGFEEIVEFTSTSSSVAEILDPSGSGVSPEDVWGTFGTGAPYGLFPIIAPGHPSGEPPTADATTHTIPLPGAIADTEAALGSSLLVITARLVTYDPDPIEELGFADALTPYEFVFGLTDVVASGFTIPAPDLIITTAAVPEPSSFVLIFGLCAAVYGYRKVKNLI